MLFDMFFSHSLIKYSYNLTHKSYKMVDNKSETSLIKHTQIYITHVDKQYNSHLGSFSVVVIATFHTDIVTPIKYFFIGFDDILTEYPKNFKERRMVIQMM